MILLLHLSHELVVLPIPVADYLINFAVNLNPNGFTVLEWPEYTAGTPNMLQFNDGLIPLSLTLDDYRVEALNFTIGLLLENPV